MNKRLWAALLGAWIIIMLVGANIALINSESSQRDGSYYGGYSTENAIYAIDRRTSGSYAYKLNSKGKVSHMIDAGRFDFELFDAITEGDEGPAVAVSRPNKVMSYSCRSYQIIVLTESLTPLSYSPVFILPETYELSSITQEAGVWYVAAVGEDGSSASVYSITSSEFKDASALPTDETTPLDEDRGAMVPSEVYSRKSDNGLAFVESTFKASTLYIRTDREEVAEAFKQDETARSAYEIADVGLTGRIRMCVPVVIGFLSFMVVGIAVFVVILVWAKRKPHLAWGVVAGLVCAMIVAGITLAACVGLQRSSDDQAVDDLTALVTSLQSRVSDIGLSWVSDTTFTMDGSYNELLDAFDCPASDILLVDTDNFNVLASKSRRNLTKLVELYGNEVNDFCKDAAEGKTARGIVTVKGSRQAVSAISMRKDYGMDYVLIGMGDVNDPVAEKFSDLVILAVIGYLILLLGIVLRAVYWKRSLDRLAESMTIVSDGKGGEITMPENGGGILSTHWEILNEIAAVLKRINYKTYQIYKAYFRFAPKKIETILDKSSIAEVNCGDVVSFTGTEAILKISDRFTESEAGIVRMNEILELMEKHQDNAEGVLVSSDMSVGLAKLIFRKKAKTLSFGLDFLHEADTLWPRESEKSGIILHHGTFRYGVAGTARQSMAFLDSAESRLLEKYSGWLYKQGLRLIITGSMKEYEGITSNLRYIGYVEEDGVRLDLYEVIDANSSEMRAKKLANLDKYNEALEHFKQSNFYFARNGFTEILRDTPGDQLVKWYLFESEKYLNQTPGDDLLKINAE